MTSHTTCSTKNTAKSEQQCINISIINNTKAPARSRWAPCLTVHILGPPPATPFQRVNKRHALWHITFHRSITRQAHHSPAPHDHRNSHQCGTPPPLLIITGEGASTTSRMIQIHHAAFTINHANRATSINGLEQHKEEKGNIAHLLHPARTQETTQRDRVNRLALQ